MLVDQAYIIPSSLGTKVTVVAQIFGTVEHHEDQWIAPTISIPLIPTIAFFWERLGVEKDATMSVLREAIAEAMRAKTNESPTIKSKMDDVAEAVAVVKRDLIGALPKMRRAGRTDVSDLKVSVSALTPVSESPLRRRLISLVGAGVVGLACCPGIYPVRLQFNRFEDSSNRYLFPCRER